jgi:aerobic-type carbon monoxide dehydrogenase small subunit (CoxS/CutS family)
MTEKKKKVSGGKTRREFLKDAGLLVGGTAIGSSVLLAACGGGETETVTNTVTRTNTATVTSTAAATTVTDTVTATTTVGAGQTATITQTTTATESKFVCPIDGTEFDSLAELQAHFEAAHPAGLPGIITLNVNGNAYITEVKPYWSLLFVLREKLGLPAAKQGCDRGECGTCTVVVDGRAIYACTMLATDAVGKNIETVEGLSDGITLSPLQQAFWENGASQCGFCTPGFLMAAKALLDQNPNPTRDEVRVALSGHLCSCGEIHNFIDSVLSV